MVFCSSDRANTVVSRANKHSDGLAVTAEYPCAYPISDEVCHRDTHIYGDRYNMRTHGETDALVEIPLPVLCTLPEQEAINRVMPRDGPSENARLRKDLDDLVQNQFRRVYPWSLNRDFVTHVLEFLRFLGDQAPRVSILSIIERPYPPQYPHTTLEGWIGYGGTEPNDGNVLEGDIQDARREALEESGVLIPNIIFDAVRATYRLDSPVHVLGNLPPYQSGLQSEHGNPLTVLAVLLPPGSRACLAQFPENPTPAGNGRFIADNLRLKISKWAGKQYVSIVVDAGAADGEQ